MKNILVLILILALLPCCALAENPHDLWLGGMLQPDLPEDAVMVGNTESEQGYVAQFTYADAYIIHARFKSDALRQRYMNIVFPAEQVREMENCPEIAGRPTRQLQWETRKSDPLSMVDAYLFETEEDFFLFITSVEKNAYCNPDTVLDYPALIAAWAQSIEIITPQ